MVTIADDEQQAGVQLPVIGDEELARVVRLLRAAGLLPGPSLQGREAS
jgi:hypothetical protein